MARKQAAKARRALDRRVGGLAGSDATASPAGGWIRAIRDALGMSADQLGRRLGVSRQAVISLERSERDGGIRLSSLRRVAEAMDCQVVYALVPNTTLEDTVQREARRVAATELARVDQTMLLEAQRIEGAAAADQLTDRAAALVDTAHLWDAD